MPTPESDRVITALLGHGIVGAEVLRRLEAHHPEVEVRHVLVQDVTKHEEKYDEIRGEEGGRGAGGTRPHFTTDMDVILDDTEVRLVIELVGGDGDATGYIRQSLGKGRHVVTANKAVIARHGRELSALALAKGSEFCFEAAVGGGLPLVQVIRELRWDYGMDFLSGILNGTSNYILTHLGFGHDYATGLDAAMRNGFAEADPSKDIDGTDSASKIAILASLGFGTWVDFTKIQYSGLKGKTVDCLLYPQDFAFFRDECSTPYEIKLLSTAKRTTTGEIELTTGLALIPARNSLSVVDFQNNALWASGPGIQQQYFFGPGAGPAPTAIAVISDVANVVDRLLGGSEPARWRDDFGGRALPIVEPGKVKVDGWIRSVSPDVLGVFPQKSAVLSRHGINMQKLDNFDDPIPVFGAPPDYILINGVEREVLDRAMIDLAALDIVLDEPVFFRIEHGLPDRGRRGNKQLGRRTRNDPNDDRMILRALPDADEPGN